MYNDVETLKLFTMSEKVQPNYLINNPQFIQTKYNGYGELIVFGRYDESKLSNLNQYIIMSLLQY